MSHSFGEGYATRSDEEGFGGIYGGNQSIPKVEIDKEIHENHPGKWCLLFCCKINNILIVEIH